MGYKSYFEDVNKCKCEMCGRMQVLTFHHLIPKTLHSNKWFEKNFEKKDMRERGIMVCQECHSAIHKFIEEKDLGRNYNTKELLLSHEKVANFVKWIAKR